MLLLLGLSLFLLFSTWWLLGYLFYKKRYGWSRQIADKVVKWILLEGDLTNG